MSIVIRDVREHELDAVLALNNNAGSAILPLDAERLRYFYDNAEYFRVAERDGALAGMLVGAVTVIAWKESGSTLYEIVPGFIAATVAVVVVSLLGRAPGAQLQARHDEVHRTLRDAGY